MLATLQSVLRKAQRGGYAVGAFNVSNLEQTQAVIQAAVAERSPVIVNTSEKAIAYAGLEEIAVLVQTMAKKNPIPIVLDLDHGRSVPLARRCLAIGYSGIMFDGSHLEYAANVQNTAAVVRAGHARGVGVEGEVGLVKYPTDWKFSRELVLTNPIQAIDFVRRTKVDAFAVAIGNSHGLPRKNERLHFGLLAEIRRHIQVPLVLHGASGTSAVSIRHAIRLGICKINIDTDLRLAFSTALRKTLKQRELFDPRDLLTPSHQAVYATVRQKMRLFGSHRKA